MFMYNVLCIKWWLFCHLKMSNVPFFFSIPKLLPENAVAIRLMPNLPCLVQEGALLFALGSHAKREDAALLRSLLHRCGLVEEGPEAWIDIHCGLSGSGVAFVSFVILGLDV